MASAPRLEWWTSGDATTLAAVAGPWQIVPASAGAEELFRVHTSPAVTDWTDLWRRATGPARVETLHGERVVVITHIDERGELTTRAAADATPDQLAMHSDALAAALATRVAGVQAALAGLAADDIPLMPLLHAWFTARITPGG